MTAARDERYVYSLTARRASGHCLLRLTGHVEAKSRSAAREHARKSAVNAGCGTVMSIVVYREKTSTGHA